MDMKEATAIVVRMAEDRDADSGEGLALRIILRDLRLHRETSNTAEEAIKRMSANIAQEVGTI